MSTYFERVQQSAAFLRNWISGEKPPEICVVLGSGLASSVPQLENERFISYNEIPGFNKVTVEGHVAELRMGTLVGAGQDNKTVRRQVAFLRGRTHTYEGHNAGEVAHNVRSLVTLGCKAVVLTNASGCLNPDWQLGTVMLIRDQINQTGLSPIFGEYGNGFGKRFADLTKLYCRDLAKCFTDVAAEQNQLIYEGVYYGVKGPDYETPAEIKMMRLLGADAVGMSTVLEAIAAKHLGARVAGLSCLTNYGAGIQGSILEHEHVVHMGKKFSKEMASLLVKALPRMQLD